MKYMNDYDIASARRRFGRGSTPNRLALVLVVDNLREWADSHSDGWHSWPKPCTAARSAIEHIESRTNRENDEQEANDITESQMLAAVRPIKSFLTRHNVSPEWKERILRSID